MPDPVPDLRDHTTLRLGGPGREWVRATTEDELVAAVSEADAAAVAAWGAKDAASVILGASAAPAPQQQAEPAPAESASAPASASPSASEDAKKEGHQ